MHHLNDLDAIHNPTELSEREEHEAREEYAAWAAAQETGHFDDECPELEDWHPSEEDLAWWEAELSHLEDGRDRLAHMPLTLAALDGEIRRARVEVTRRRLGTIDAGFMRALLG